MDINYTITIRISKHNRVLVLGSNIFFLNWWHEFPDYKAKYLRKIVFILIRRWHSRFTWYAPLPFDTDAANVLASEVCIQKRLPKCLKIGILENSLVFNLQREGGKYVILWFMVRCTFTCRSYSRAPWRKSGASMLIVQSLPGNLLTLVCELQYPWLPTKLCLHFLYLLLARTLKGQANANGEC